MVNFPISQSPELFEALQRRIRIIEGASLDAKLRLDEPKEEARKKNRREAQRTRRAAGTKTSLHQKPASEQSQNCSESRLRKAMTQSGVSTEELKGAILAVEALVGEARRELKNRQFRERRAAYERLYAAISRADEAVLPEAIAEARRTEVDAEDIEKAEDALRSLQAMTDEERAAKAAKERETECRSRAFLLVKRDDDQALKALLEELDAAGTKWQGWRDHAQRTLLQCAGTLGARKVQAFLGPILKPKPVATVQPRCIDPENSPLSHMKFSTPELSPMAHAVASLESAAAEVDTSVSKPEPEAKKANHVRISPTVDFHFPGEALEAAAPILHQPETTAEEPKVMPVDEAVSAAAPEPEVAPELEVPSAEQAGALAPEEETKLRLAAFRAVVKDDTPTLGDIIFEKVPEETWRNWVNKGGKDLLTLSEERGSTGAYSMLARALGLLKARKRSSFCEREFVWVMLAGDVQPRQATVIEDVADEADQIFIEFWDDDSDPMWVDRDFVLKSS